VLLRERARMRADDASDAAEKHRYAADHKPADTGALADNPTGLLPVIAVGD
jgi:hypothetical protein